MAGGELWEILAGRMPGHDVPFLEPEPPFLPGQPRRLAMVLSYDGGGYAGWQVQPGLRTLQGEVEAALSQICHQPLRLVASGRTDAGVHALGQVASFTTTSRLALKDLGRGLRALLGPGLGVRALGPVPLDFHARYSAQAKTYDYFLWPGGDPGPFLRGRLWHIPRPLDAAAMDRALELLPGPRDLAGLASQGSEAPGGTVRLVLEAALLTSPDGPWRVRLTATGFLRHVVRNLLGLLYKIGAGHLAPQAILETCQAGRRLMAGPKAPPQGLYLNRVYYGPWPGPGGGEGA